jgi:LL-diaminopimelate aminotransferase
LRQTVARWLSTHHEVEADPDRNILILIGSKEGLAHLPFALVEERDEVLVPDPGYPVYGEATILAGGLPVPFPLLAERGFRPSPADLSDRIGRRTRLLFLNYPNNPTGTTASREVFRPVVALGAGHGFAVANDAAYLEVVLEGERPVSLLTGADLESDPVIEFHSLSKMFNMTGWRIGFAVGHADLIAGLGRVKKSFDSGVFSAIQEVAEFALGDVFPELIGRMRSVYRSRRKVILPALANAGIEVMPTRATFYVWARVPDGEGSLAFCRRLLAEVGLVVTPGVGFGPGGEGWFRLSLTAPDEQIAAAAERLGEL